MRLEKLTMIIPELRHLRKLQYYMLLNMAVNLKVGQTIRSIAPRSHISIVEAHLKTMARLNVSYDLLTWESVDTARRTVETYL